MKHLQVHTNQVDSWVNYYKVSGLGITPQGQEVELGQPPQNPLAVPAAVATASPAITAV